MNRTSKHRQTWHTGLIAALLLVGCQGGEAEKPLVHAGAPLDSGAPERRAIASCMISGAQVAYEETPEGSALTITSPNGAPLSRVQAGLVTQSSIREDTGVYCDECRSTCSRGPGLTVHGMLKQTAPLANDVLGGDEVTIKLDKAALRELLRERVDRPRK